MQKIILSLATGLFAINASQAALVVNGDFENGTTGWNTSSDVTTVPGGVSGNAAKMTIETGGNASFISYMSQDIGPSGTYTIDFDMSRTGLGGTWSAFLGDVVLVNDFVSASNPFTHYQFTATAGSVTPGSHAIIQFYFYQNGESSAMLIDNVAASVAVVPEPATMAAGAAAMVAAGFGLVRRARHSRVVVG